MKKFLLVLTFLFLSNMIFSQEALKSIEEEYYDFLSLTGVVERPTLGYRTLSDSVWTYNEVESLEENEDGTFTKVLVSGEESDQNIWKNNNLGTTYTLWSAEDPADNWFVRGLKQAFTMRIYGPEWFNSYNTAAPYGQNDGALWQGRGYNTAFTGGVRFEGYGFEATFKPQVSFSQNLEFEYIRPNYSGANYAGKASIYGYYGVPSIDAPQRFGDSAFWNFDWGDSEARWTWNTFTVGFGTQTIWLGPAKLNPIIHSNNAPSYPKLDIGVRKTKLTMPYFGWDLGYIEARGWVGYLTESAYFDNDETNNHNMINGFFFAYEPPKLSGLSIGFTKITLSKWGLDDNALKYFNPFHSTNTGIGTAIGDDQKASLFISWLMPRAEIEIYGEIGVDDYSPNGFGGLLQYPFDTMIYTVGFNKNIDFIHDNSVYANIQFEWNAFDKNAHRTTGNYVYTFYAHSQITQGYTNQGQWLGAGTGTGSNSQYLGINIFYPKGNTKISFHRFNVDNDYAYLKWNYEAKYCYKSNFIIQIVSTYFICDNFRISSGIAWDCIINSDYKNVLAEGLYPKDNFRIQLSLAYQL